MRAADAFRISVHNIRFNAVRTLLTVLIVTVVSSLVMFLLLLGIAFERNLDGIARAYFLQNGAEYTFYGLKTWADTPIASSRPILPEEYELFRTNAEKHRDVYGDDLALGYDDTGHLGIFVGEYEGLDGRNENGISFSIYSITAKSFTTVPAGYVFREGRAWEPSDSASSNVFVSREYQRICEQNGVALKIGMQIPLLSTAGPYEVELFTLAGIYEDPAGQNGSAFYIGMDKLFELSQNTLADIGVLWISVDFTPPDADYDYNAALKSMQAFTDDMNGALEQPYEDLAGFEGFEFLIELFSDYSRRFTNDFVDSVRVVNLLSGIVIGVFFMLALLVLLLSVGSVANSVVISIDKNKKFFGMMKAVGLDTGGIRSLVYFELFLVILGGVALGIGLVYALVPTIHAILASLLHYLWGSLIAFSISVTVPFWLPLGTIALFLVLTMLFSLGSIRKIAAQDVMATLAEVA